MPLTGTGGIGLPNDRRRAIGFWMTNKARPIEPVRVFVTYEAIWQLDPTHPQDVPAAIGIFGRPSDAGPSHQSEHRPVCCSIGLPFELEAAV